MIAVYIVMIFAIIMYSLLDTRDSFFIKNKKFKRFPSNIIFLDENGKKVNNSEIYCIEGENLAYKNFHDGDFVHIMKNHSFKKGDIVLTNDFELFEVKTRHKNNTVSLYKNNNKKRVDIKEIIGTVVGYYKYK